jgi:uncharacterized protein YbcI
VNDLRGKHAERGTVALAIANATVRLMSEHTGRGPTKARTHLSKDMITVVLEQSMTTGERSLQREGKGELVLTVRRAYQETVAPQLIDAVQRLSGRRVLAFLSANNLEPDLAVETFMLAPANGDEEELPALKAARSGLRTPG